MLYFDCVISFTQTDLKKWTRTFFFLLFYRLGLVATTRKVAEKPFQGGTLQFAGSVRLGPDSRRGCGGHEDSCAIVQSLFGLAGLSRIYPQYDTEPTNLSWGIRGPAHVWFMGSQQSPHFSISTNGLSGPQCMCFCFHLKVELIQWVLFFICSFVLVWQLDGEQTGETWVPRLPFAIL